MTTFLSPDELAVLTGRKRKAHQIAALRQQGVPSAGPSCYGPR